MKILKSILNYIPLATFIIFVVTDGIFSLTSALIFVISTIGLLINWKRKKQRWRIEKIPVYRDDRITIYEMMYELTSLSNGRSLGIPGILFLLIKSTCVSISLAMYEYACTCSNDMMNHYNKVGVQKWSDLIAYGIWFNYKSY